MGKKNIRDSEDARYLTSSFSVAASISVSPVCEFVEKIIFGLGASSVQTAS